MALPASRQLHDQLQQRGCPCRCGASSTWQPACQYPAIGDSWRARGGAFVFWRWSSSRPGVATSRFTPLIKRSASARLLAPPMTSPAPVPLSGDRPPQHAGVMNHIILHVFTGVLGRRCGSRQLHMHCPLPTCSPASRTELCSSLQQPVPPGWHTGHQGAPCVWVCCFISSRATL